MLKVVTQLVVVGAQAEAVRFRNHRFFVNELLGSLPGEKGHQGSHLSAAPGKLPQDHLMRFTLHLGHGHLFVADGGEHAGWRRTKAKAIADAAGDECDGHRGTDDDKQGTQDDFQSGAGVLQLSYHSEITPSGLLRQTTDRFGSIA